MATEQRPELRVITNLQHESEQKTSANAGYHTNPMYEKLIKFTSDKKRRFTVEDLLKW